ncbi:MAG: hypothetical protein QXR87_03325 [Candidatus Hadarchaeales archaeon]
MNGVVEAFGYATISVLVAGAAYVGYYKLLGVPLPAQWHALLIPVFSSVFASSLVARRV